MSTVRRQDRERVRWGYLSNAFLTNKTVVLQILKSFMLGWLWSEDCLFRKLMVCLGQVVIWYLWISIQDYKVVWRQLDLLGLAERIRPDRRGQVIYSRWEPYLLRRIVASWLRILRLGCWVHRRFGRSRGVEAELVVRLKLVGFVSCSCLWVLLLLKG